jgi:hypothetical protein
MGFWDFHQTADRHWQWRYVSENMSPCLYSGRFRSRNDCIADAMRHGYLSDHVPVAPDARQDIVSSNRKDLHAPDTNVAPFLQRLLIY